MLLFFVLQQADIKTMQAYFLHVSFIWKMVESNFDALVSYMFSVWVNSK